MPPALFDMFYEELLTELMKSGDLVINQIKNLVITKQWPLAGEFVEFEYSPKIRQFWRIRVLAKMAILDNRSDSIHSPTLASLLCPDSIHSPDIRQPVSPDSIHSPDIRQPLSPDSIHSRKANLATFTRI